MRAPKYRLYFEGECFIYDSEKGSLNGVGMDSTKSAILNELIINHGAPTSVDSLCKRSNLNHGSIEVEISSLRDYFSKSKEIRRIIKKERTGYLIVDECKIERIEEYTESDSNHIYE